MRKMFTGISVAAALIAAVAFSTISVSAAPTAVDVTITGQAVAVINTLAKDQAANAIPALADLNVLKVNAATGADGKAIADLKGKTLYFIPVKSAESLVAAKDAAGKWFEIKGRVFKAEGALLVTESKATKAPADDFGTLPTKTVTRQQVL